MLSQEKSPFSIFSNWYASAANCGLKEPTAVNFATAGRQGRPSNRTVLLKSWDDKGFVIFTNFTSHKGRDLAENPYGALCFYWMPLGRQVRVEGAAEQVTDAEADAYFASRARDSQLGAWASLQSQPMAHEGQLKERYEAVKAEYEGRDVPRPPHWVGIRIVPEVMEFWEERPFRMHERLVYRNCADGWKKEILFP